MSNPTDAQINRVKQNLNKMIIFNRDLLTNTTIKILNAYALLSMEDSSDLGLQIGLNLLDGSFWAIGGELGPAGSIFANFMCGLVASYSTSTPPSLNEAFSSLLTRYEATSNQASDDMAILYQDPVSYWNKTYSGTVNNPFGSYAVSGSLSDLDSIDFPAQTDPEYYTLLNACIYALDQCVWAQLLPNFVITHYIESNPPEWPSDTDPNADDDSFYAIHKAYYHVWTYHDETDKNGEHLYYTREEYNIGTGCGMFSDGSLNDDACNYLFIDYSPDTIINTNGLFHRDFVFNNLPIPKTDKYLAHSSYDTFYKYLGLLCRCFRRDGTNISKPLYLKQE